MGERERERARERGASVAAAKRIPREMGTAQLSGKLNFGNTCRPRETTLFRLGHISSNWPAAAGQLTSRW